MEKKKVLFLCTHNSCRSQMAEALLRHHLDHRYEVFSAGTEATSVNESAISALQMKRISTHGLRSKSVDEFLDVQIDEVVTVCNNAKENCPFFPGAKNYTHKSFPDPPDLVADGMPPEDAFSKVRDMIEEWILEHFT